MSEPAIACSLSPDDQTKRVEAIADLCNRALAESQPTAAGLRLRFAAEPGIGEELEQLIEAESRCCSFLRFELDSTDGGLLLTVSGSDDARSVIEGMFGSSSRP